MKKIKKAGKFILEALKELPDDGIYASNRVINFLVANRLRYVYTDGGRVEAQIKTNKDCVTRAMSIALNKDYKKVYDEIYWLQKKMHKKKPEDHDNTSPRDGVNTFLYEEFLKKYNIEFKFRDIQIGHLNLRRGTYICLEIDHKTDIGHTFIVKNGIIHDTFAKGNLSRPLIAYAKIEDRGYSCVS